MLVEWTPMARAALWTILDFIGERNVGVAQALFEAIEDATQALPLYP